MNKRKILIFISLSLFIIFLLYSFIFVGTIPIAIVSGNSMYPTLQNGDIVIFQPPPQHEITNGTIIIYAQQGINDKFFSWLTGNLIIHRIVAIHKINNNTYYYITKGDNNILNDSLPVFQKQVVGIPVFVIPKIGYIVFFIESPYGVIFIIGLLVTIYLRSIDIRQEFERRISKFILILGKESLKGNIPKEIYEKAEIYIKYAYDVDEIDDENIRKIALFVSKTKLKGYNQKNFTCEKCGKGILFEAESFNLKICFDNVELLEKKK